MHVLEETDNRVAPKSLLRHRPITNGTVPTKKRASSAPNTKPVVQRASRPHQADVDVGLAHNTTNTRTVKTSGNSERDTKVTRPSLTSLPFGKKISAHPLIYLGLGMAVALALWIGLSAALNWFTTTLDDIKYGRPRTFQADAWVGHNEQTGMPSHFIAINLNRNIEIVEIAGGDPAHTHIYTGPELYGKGDELTPVTLKFVDVNGDGKPDMIVLFQDSQFVFINDHGTFRPMLPSERQHVDSCLLKQTACPHP